MNYRPTEGKLISDQELIDVLVERGVVKAGWEIFLDTDGYNSLRLAYQFVNGVPVNPEHYPEPY